MRTFISQTPRGKDSTRKEDDYGNDALRYEVQIPLPTLPIIDCSSKRARMKPLTIEEYEEQFADNATDLELVERVFYGSMSCNQLRAALWPYIFGLVKKRGRFLKANTQSSAYTYIENEENKVKWLELEKLYKLYENQWKSILPEQESRFTTLRERKALIERDVIRLDRLHPFYVEHSHNLIGLTNILMTYMMYDFDIGYVQGMSDLAGPILFVYNCDIVKSFWVFVEVMKLFRRNFELTQKTIDFQLNCLFKLVKVTDPIFAHYLIDHDTANCFFAFRAIVCLFKRELMREDENDYSKVLTLWDTIWCVNKRHLLLEELKENTVITKMSTDDQVEQQKPKQQSSQKVFLYTHLNINQADSARHHLTVIEKFVLALCLSMIRRERDIVLARQLDGTDIHLHFIDPKLASDLEGFIEHAINIYSYLMNDFDINILSSKEDVDERGGDGSSDSPQASASEGYDLLSDYLIINAASGS